MKIKILLLTVLILLAAGVGSVAYYVLTYGLPEIFASDPFKDLRRATEKWKMADFKGYDRLFTHPEKFEEILFLNFLKGDITLRCDVSNGNLLCSGFTPMTVKKVGKKYAILNTKIYLNDTSGTLMRKRRKLADWQSKLSALGYYEALEVCAGQMRNRTKSDSLYLEREAFKEDTVVLRKLIGQNLNSKFYEILEDRLLRGHICLTYSAIKDAHMRFNKHVKSEVLNFDWKLKSHLKRKGRLLAKVEKELRESLQKSRDPLALAYYKRGLQYYSKGDLASARIFLKRALKVDTNFKEAKEALEKINEIIRNTKGR